MLNEVMFKFAELLEQLPEHKEVQTEIELLPNRVAELTIEGPILYTENVFVQTAADEDLKILREKHRAIPSTDIIEQAHPKSVYVSNAQGQGGLVENQNEQQAKIIQMINKRPTGQHWNIYAGFVEDLVKIANKLDESGHLDLASETDQLLHLISK